MNQNQPINIEPGFYTLVYPNGAHRTLQVKIPKNGFLKGQKIIGYLTGSDNTKDYTFVGVIKENGQLYIWNTWIAKIGHDQLKIARFRRAVEILNGDQDQAGKIYALNSGNCYRCNRLLTNPESIVEGIGPECSRRAAKKAAANRAGMEAMAA